MLVVAEVTSMSTKLVGRLDDDSYICTTTARVPRLWVIVPATLAVRAIVPEALNATPVIAPVLEFTLVTADAEVR